MQCHNGLQNTPEHTRTTLCTRLHNTAHTPFSPPLPCTSHQPNNNRRISDAELNPFKMWRLSVSCDARTEHMGKEPRLSPCTLSSWVIVSSYVQSHPAPVCYSANAVKHTPLLNSTQHMHSTWQAARTLAMRTLLYACPQLCSSHAANSFHWTCHAQLLSRHICTKQSPPSHAPLLQLAFAHTSACSLASAASEHFAHKHCCTQTTFTCILDRVTHMLFLHQ
jgi:hypothetical protein